MHNSLPCPYYQGVCGLNEDFICYANYDSCDIYREWAEAQDRKNDNAKNSEEDSREEDNKINKEVYFSCKDGKKIPMPLESSMDTAIYGNRRKVLGTEMVEKS